MHDGGEAYEYDNSDRENPNFQGEADQRESANDAAADGQNRNKSGAQNQAARQRTRKEKMNIKRYESNSIDEEEF